MAPRAGTDRRSRWRRAVLLAAATALVLAGCGVGRSKEAGPSPEDDQSGVLQTAGDTFPAVTFDLVHQRLHDRVIAAGLSGGMLVVTTQDGNERTESFGQGDMAIDTVLPMAETSMLPTTVVLLSLVDDGTLDLDQPIGAHLGWMTGPSGAITLRQLLSHTSGLPATVVCPAPTPDACDLAVAAVPLVHAPGEGFLVTDLDAHVAARLAETVTGRPWAELFDERVALPAAMRVTRYADASTTGGLVAVDGTTTAWDLGALLAVLRDSGMGPTMRVLSESSVREMLLDQTVRLDTHDEPWVAETGVPTYGLGVWRDRLRGDDMASVVSAPNRYGLYPFVDLGRSAWGVVVIDDHVSRQADAVSASATIVQLTAAALRNSPD